MKRLASLKLAAFAIVALAGGVAWSYATQTKAVWGVAAPMALLAVNLGAALATNPVFRRNAPLLVFHVALVALALLAAAGRLTYLNGRVELSAGETFDGELLDAERGPLHASKLDRVTFTNEGFEIDYAPRWKRIETRNRVRWRDESGIERAAVIGDQTPLVLLGYRFYTTSNKGFAPVFEWRPAEGRALRGSLHMPSYPVLEFGQSVDWTLPGGSEQLTVKLHISEELIDPDKAGRFRLPSEHRVEIEARGRSYQLRPGEAVKLAGGELRYEGLRTWMGYVVFHDWTLPWLLAACVVAIAGLGWHFWRRLAARPWEVQ